MYINEAEAENYISRNLKGWKQKLKLLGCSVKCK